jgi:hypothetical protein
MEYGKQRVGEKRLRKKADATRSRARLRIELTWEK